MIDGISKSIWNNLPEWDKDLAMGVAAVTIITGVVIAAFAKQRADSVRQRNSARLEQEQQLYNLEQEGVSVISLDRNNLQIHEIQPFLDMLMQGRKQEDLPGLCLGLKQAIHLIPERPAPYTKLFLVLVDAIDKNTPAIKEHLRPADLFTVALSTKKDITNETGIKWEECDISPYYDEVRTDRFWDAIVDYEPERKSRLRALFV